MVNRPEDANARCSGEYAKVEETKSSFSALQGRPHPTGSRSPIQVPHGTTVGSR